MKYKLRCLLAVFTGFVVTSAFADDYEIDIEGQHAAVSFKVSHLGYSYIVGRFNRFEGEFSYDEDAPEDSEVDVVIDARSIDTNHAEQDKHLRDEDFFDVGQYPEVRFESTGYEEGDEFDTLTGELTLRGVTREVELEIDFVGAGADPWGGHRAGFSAFTVLDSAEFGFEDWIGEVEVDIEIEGVRK